MSVVVVGANHRTAPLDLLERMAVSGERLPKLLHALDAGADTSEVVVLATCNRTEVYLVAERFHGAYAEVRDFFADLTFLPPERFAESLYVHYDDAAVRHLFEVTAGLDSAVPGEHEILGQVGSAWELARRGHRPTGPRPPVPPRARGRQAGPHRDLDRPSRHLGVAGRGHPGR